MSTYKVEVDVDAPPDRIWRVMADVPDWPQWTPTVGAVESLTEGPLRVGSRFRLEQPRLPPVIWTVDELEPGRSFSWTSGSRALSSRGYHGIKPAAGGSRVVLTFTQSGPLAPVSGLVYRKLISRYVQTEADSLKARSEDVRTHEA